MSKKCFVCSKVIKDYEPDVRIVDNKKRYYCISHMFGFYFMCPYCNEPLLSSNTEQDRHLLILKTPSSGILLCPKFSNNHHNRTMLIKSFKKIDAKIGARLLKRARGEKKMNENKKEE